MLLEFMVPEFLVSVGDNLQAQRFLVFPDILRVQTRCYGTFSCVFVLFLVTMVCGVYGLRKLFLVQVSFVFVVYSAVSLLQT